MFLHYAFPMTVIVLILSHILLRLIGLFGWSGDEESRRSRSALATSLAPPSLVEGMISSAIQRRTVLIDMP